MFDPALITRIRGEEEESVKVKCFGCDALIEAADSEAVAYAFVAHGQERHTWSYPEEAIRNYARNYAEATERLTGGTERLSAIGEITVHPVTKDRIDNWLRFFDHDAFAGNPDWASCYCLEPHVPATPEQPERVWRETRGTVAERLRGGTMFGYLAYADGRPAGWVNASRRSDYGLYRHVDPDGPEPTSVIGVSCFVIAPPFRRQGIASALLDRVIADASARGAAWIEGYPLNKPEESDAGHFRGPRSMYDARGFEPITVRERDTVVRLSAIRAPLPSNGR
jgi:GNAT superfamily N-acetyltransferase